MKKRLAAAVIILVLAVQTLIPCIAANSGIKVILDGKTLDFDVPPVIQDGRTLVPMRAIFEKLGYTVEWNEENRAIKATDGSNTINMYIDFYTFWRNGEALPTDVAPCIVDGRTLVPVRVVSEASGCSVQWNEVTQTVFIGKPERSRDIITATPTPTATPEPTPDLGDFYLDKTELTIKENESYTFETTVKAWLADEKIIWSSSDYRVATVSNKGKVTGVESGTCTITAKVKNITAECEVTVQNVPKNPDLEVMGFNTTKLFVENRNYLTITIFNYGTLPVTIDGTGKYSYITGAEGDAYSIVNEAMYDIYTINLSSPQTVIAPKSYKVLTFTKTADKPSVGSRTLKKDFDETFEFSFTYDGKQYNAKKLKIVKKSDGSTDDKKDFTY